MDFWGPQASLRTKKHRNFPKKSQLGRNCKNFLSVSYLGPRILGSSSLLINLRVNLCKTTPNFLKVDDDAINLLEHKGSNKPGSKAIGIVSDYHKWMSNG